MGQINSTALSCDPVTGSTHHTLTIESPTDGLSQFIYILNNHQPIFLPTTKDTQPTPATTPSSVGPMPQTPLPQNVNRDNIITKHDFHDLKHNYVNKISMIQAMLELFLLAGADPNMTTSRYFVGKSYNLFRYALFSQCSTDVLLQILMSGGNVEDLTLPINAFQLYTANPTVLTTLLGMGYPLQRVSYRHIDEITMLPSILPQHMFHTLNNYKNYLIYKFQQQNPHQLPHPSSISQTTSTSTINSINANHNTNLNQQNHGITNPLYHKHHNHCRHNQIPLHTACLPYPHYTSLNHNTESSSHPNNSGASPTFNKSQSTHQKPHLLYPYYHFIRFNQFQTFCSCNINTRNNFINDVFYNCKGDIDSSYKQFNDRKDAASTNNNQDKLLNDICNELDNNNKYNLNNGFNTDSIQAAILYAKSPNRCFTDYQCRDPQHSPTKLFPITNRHRTLTEWLFDTLPHPFHSNLFFHLFYNPGYLIKYYGYRLDDSAVVSNASPTTHIDTSANAFNTSPTNYSTNSHVTGSSALQNGPLGILGVIFDPGTVLSLNNNSNQAGTININTFYTTLRHHNQKNSQIINKSLPQPQNAYFASNPPKSSVLSTPSDDTLTECDILLSQQYISDPTLFFQYRKIQAIAPQSPPILSPQTTSPTEPTQISSQTFPNNNIGFTSSVMWNKSTFHTPTPPTNLHTIPSLYKPNKSNQYYDNIELQSLTPTISSLPPPKSIASSTSPNPLIDSHVITLPTTSPTFLQPAKSLIKQHTTNIADIMFQQDLFTDTTADIYGSNNIDKIRQIQKLSIITAKNTALLQKTIEHLDSVSSHHSEPPCRSHSGQSQKNGDSESNTTPAAKEPSLNASESVVLARHSRLSSIQSTLTVLQPNINSGGFDPAIYGIPGNYGDSFSERYSIGSFPGHYNILQQHLDGISYDDRAIPIITINKLDPTLPVPIAMSLTGLKKFQNNAPNRDNKDSVPVYSAHQSTRHSSHRSQSESLSLFVCQQTTHSCIHYEYYMYPSTAVNDPSVISPRFIARKSYYLYTKSDDLEIDPTAPVTQYNYNIKIPVYLLFNDYTQNNSLNHNIFKNYFISQKYTKFLQTIISPSGDSSKSCKSVSQFLEKLIETGGIDESSLLIILLSQLFTGKPLSNSKHQLLLLNLLSQPNNLQQLFSLLSIIKNQNFFLQSHNPQSSPNVINASLYSHYQHNSQYQQYQSSSSQQQHTSTFSPPPTTHPYTPPLLYNIFTTRQLQLAIDWSLLDQYYKDEHGGLIWFILMNAPNYQHNELVFFFNMLSVEVPFSEPGLSSIGAALYGSYQERQLLVPVREHPTIPLHPFMYACLRQYPLEILLMLLPNWYEINTLSLRQDTAYTSNNVSTLIPLSDLYGRSLLMYYFAAFYHQYLHIPSYVTTTHPLYIKYSTNQDLSIKLFFKCLFLSNLTQCDILHNTAFHYLFTLHMPYEYLPLSLDAYNGFFLKIKAFLSQQEKKAVQYRLQYSHHTNHQYNKQIIINMRSMAKSIDQLALQSPTYYLNILKNDTPNFRFSPNSMLSHPKNCHVNLKHYNTLINIHPLLFLFNTMISTISPLHLYPVLTKTNKYNYGIVNVVLLSSPIHTIHYIVFIYYHMYCMKIIHQILLCQFKWRHDYQKIYNSYHKYKALVKDVPHSSSGSQSSITAELPRFSLSSSSKKDKREYEAGTTTSSSTKVSNDRKIANTSHGNIRLLYDHVPFVMNIAPIHHNNNKERNIYDILPQIYQQNIENHEQSLESVSDRSDVDKHIPSEITRMRAISEFGEPSTTTGQISEFSSDSLVRKTSMNTRGTDMNTHVTNHTPGKFSSTSQTDLQTNTTRATTYTHEQSLQISFSNPLLPLPLYGGTHHVDYDISAFDYNIVHDYHQYQQTHPSQQTSSHHNSIYSSFSNSYHHLSDTYHHVDGQTNTNTSSTRRTEQNQRKNDSSSLQSYDDIILDNYINHPISPAFFSYITPFSLQPYTKTPNLVFAHIMSQTETFLLRAYGHFPMLSTPLLPTNKAHMDENSIYSIKPRRTLVSGRTRKMHPNTDTDRDDPYSESISANAGDTTNQIYQAIEDSDYDENSMNTLCSLFDPLSINLNYSKISPSSRASQVIPGKDDLDDFVEAGSFDPQYAAQLNHYPSQTSPLKPYKATDPFENNHELKTISNLQLFLKLHSFFDYEYLPTVEYFINTFTSFHFSHTTGRLYNYLSTFIEPNNTLFKFFALHKIPVLPMLYQSCINSTTNLRALQSTASPITASPSQRNVSIRLDDTIFDNRLLSMVLLGSYSDTSPQSILTQDVINQIQPVVSQNITNPQNSTNFSTTPLGDPKSPYKANNPLQSDPPHSKQRQLQQLFKNQLDITIIDAFQQSFTQYQYPLVYYIFFSHGWLFQPMADYLSPYKTQAQFIANNLLQNDKDLLSPNLVNNQRFTPISASTHQHQNDVCHPLDRSHSLSQSVEGEFDPFVLTEVRDLYSQFMLIYALDQFDQCNQTDHVISVKDKLPTGAEFLSTHHYLDALMDGSVVSNTLGNITPRGNIKYPVGGQTRRTSNAQSIEYNIMSYNNLYQLLPKTRYTHTIDMLHLSPEYHSQQLPIPHSPNDFSIMPTSDQDVSVTSDDSSSLHHPVTSQNTIFHSGIAVTVRLDNSTPPTPSNASNSSGPANHKELGNSSLSDKYSGVPHDVSGVPITSCASTEGDMIEIKSLQRRNSIEFADKSVNINLHPTHYPGEDHSHLKPMKNLSHVQNMTLPIPPIDTTLHKTCVALKTTQHLDNHPTPHSTIPTTMFHSISPIQLQSINSIFFDCHMNNIQTVKVDDDNKSLQCSPTLVTAPNYLLIDLYIPGLVYFSQNYKQLAYFPSYSVAKFTSQGMFHNLEVAQPPQITSISPPHNAIPNTTNTISGPLVINPTLPFKMGSTLSPNSVASPPNPAVTQRQVQQLPQIPLHINAIKPHHDIFNLNYINFYNHYLQESRVVIEPVDFNVLFSSLSTHNSTSSNSVEKDGDITQKKHLKKTVYSESQLLRALTRSQFPIHLFKNSSYLDLIAHKHTKFTFNASQNNQSILAESGPTADNLNKSGTVSSTSVRNSRRSTGRKRSTLGPSIINKALTPEEELNEYLSRHLPKYTPYTQPSQPDFGINHASLLYWEADLWSNYLNVYIHESLYPTDKNPAIFPYPPKRYYLPTIPTPQIRVISNPDHAQFRTRSASRHNILGSNAAVTNVAATIQRPQFLNHQQHINFLQSNIKQSPSMLSGVDIRPRDGYQPLIVPTDVPPPELCENCQNGGVKPCLKQQQIKTTTASTSSGQSSGSRNNYDCITNLKNYQHSLNQRLVSALNDDSIAPILVTNEFLSDLRNDHGLLKSPSQVGILLDSPSFSRSSQQSSIFPSPIQATHQQQFKPQQPQQSQSTPYRTRQAHFPIIPTLGTIIEDDMETEITQDHMGPNDIFRFCGPSILPLFNTYLNDLVLISSLISCDKQLQNAYSTKLDGSTSFHFQHNSPLVTNNGPQMVHQNQNDLSPLSSFDTSNTHTTSSTISSNHIVTEMAIPRSYSSLSTSSETAGSTGSHLNEDLLSPLSSSPYSSLPGDIHYHYHHVLRHSFITSNFGEYILQYITPLQQERLAQDKRISQILSYDERVNQMLPTIPTLKIPPEYPTTMNFFQTAGFIANFTTYPGCFIPYTIGLYAGSKSSMYFNDHLAPHYKQTKACDIAALFHLFSSHQPQHFHTYPIIISDHIFSLLPSPLRRDYVRSQDEHFNHGNNPPTDLNSNLSPHSSKSKSNTSKHTIIRKLPPIQPPTQQLFDLRDIQMFSFAVNVLTAAQYTSRHLQNNPVPYPKTDEPHDLYDQRTSRYVVTRPPLFQQYCIDIASNMIVYMLSEVNRSQLTFAHLLMNHYDHQQKSTYMNNYISFMEKQYIQQHQRYAAKNANTVDPQSPSQSLTVPPMPSIPFEEPYTQSYYYPSYIQLQPKINLYGDLFFTSTEPIIATNTPLTLWNIGGQHVQIGLYSYLKHYYNSLPLNFPNYHDSAEYKLFSSAFVHSHVYLPRAGNSILTTLYSPLKVPTILKKPRAAVVAKSHSDDPPISNDIMNTFKVDDHSSFFPPTHHSGQTLPDSLYDSPQISSHTNSQLFEPTDIQEHSTGSIHTNPLPVGTHFPSAEESLEIMYPRYLSYFESVLTPLHQILSMAEVRKAHLTDDPLLTSSNGNIPESILPSSNSPHLFSQPCYAMSQFSLQQLNEDYTDPQQTHKNHFIHAMLFNLGHIPSISSFSTASNDIQNQIIAQMIRGPQHTLPPKLPHLSVVPNLTIASVPISNEKVTEIKPPVPSEPQSLIELKTANQAKQHQREKGGYDTHSPSSSYSSSRRDNINSNISSTIVFPTQSCQNVPKVDRILSDHKDTEKDAKKDSEIHQLSPEQQIFIKQYLNSFMHLSLRIVQSPSDNSDFNLMTAKNNNLIAPIEQIPQSVTLGKHSVTYSFSHKFSKNKTNTRANLSQELNDNLEFKHTAPYQQDFIKLQTQFDHFNEIFKHQCEPILSALSKKDDDSHRHTPSQFNITTIQDHITYIAPLTEFIGMMTNLSRHQSYLKQGLLEYILTSLYTSHHYDNYVQGALSAIYPIPMVYHMHSLIPSATSSFPLEPPFDAHYYPRDELYHSYVQSVFTWFAFQHHKQLEVFLSTYLTTNPTTSILYSFMKGWGDKVNQYSCLDSFIDALQTTNDSSTPLDDFLPDSGEKISSDLKTLVPSHSSSSHLASTSIKSARQLQIDLLIEEYLSNKSTTVLSKTNEIVLHYYSNSTGLSLHNMAPQMVLKPLSYFVETLSNNLMCFDLNYVLPLPFLDSYYQVYTIHQYAEHMNYYNNIYSKQYTKNKFLHLFEIMSKIILINNVNQHIIYDHFYDDTLLYEHQLHQIQPSKRKLSRRGINANNNDDFSSSHDSDLDVSYASHHYCLAPVHDNQLHPFKLKKSIDGNHIQTLDHDISVSTPIMASLNQRNISKRVSGVYSELYNPKDTYHNRRSHKNILISQPPSLGFSRTPGSAMNKTTQSERGKIQQQIISQQAKVTRTNGNDFIDSDGNFTADAQKKLTQSSYQSHLEQYYFRSNPFYQHDATFTCSKRGDNNDIFGTILSGSNLQNRPIDLSDRHQMNYNLKFIQKPQLQLLKRNNGKFEYMTVILTPSVYRDILQDDDSEEYDLFENKISSVQSGQRHHNIVSNTQCNNHNSYIYQQKQIKASVYQQTLSTMKKALDEYKKLSLYQFLLNNRNNSDLLTLFFINSSANNNNIAQSYENHNKLEVILSKFKKLFTNRLHTTPFILYLPEVTQNILYSPSIHNAGIYNIPLPYSAIEMFHPKHNFFLNQIPCHSLTDGDSNEEKRFDGITCVLQFYVKQHSKGSKTLTKQAALDQLVDDIYSPFKTFHFVNHHYSSRNTDRDQSNIPANMRRNKISSLTNSSIPNSQKEVANKKSPSVRTMLFTVPPPTLIKAYQEIKSFQFSNSSFYKDCQIASNMDTPSLDADDIVPITPKERRYKTNFRDKSSSNNLPINVTSHDNSTLGLSLLKSVLYQLDVTNADDFKINRQQHAIELLLNVISSYLQFLSTHFSKSSHETQTHNMHDQSSNNTHNITAIPPNTPDHLAVADKLCLSHPLSYLSSSAQVVPSASSYFLRGKGQQASLSLLYLTKMTIFKNTIISRINQYYANLLTSYATSIAQNIHTHHRYLYLYTCLYSQRPAAMYRTVVSQSDVEFPSSIYNTVTNLDLPPITAPVNTEKYHPTEYSLSQSRIMSTPLSSVFPMSSIISSIANASIPLQNIDAIGICPHNDPLSSHHQIQITDTQKLQSCHALLNKIQQYDRYYVVCPQYNIVRIPLDNNVNKSVANRLISFFKTKISFGKGLSKSKTTQHSTTLESTSNTLDSVNCPPNNDMLNNIDQYTLFLYQYLHYQYFSQFTHYFNAITRNIPQHYAPHTLGSSIAPNMDLFFQTLHHHYTKDHCTKNLATIRNIMNDGSSSSRR